MKKRFCQRDVKNIPFSFFSQLQKKTFFDPFSALLSKEARAKNQTFFFFFSFRKRKLSSKIRLNLFLSSKTAREPSLLFFSSSRSRKENGKKLVLQFSTFSYFLPTFSSIKLELRTRKLIFLAEGNKNYWRKKEEKTFFFFRFIFPLFRPFFSASRFYDSFYRSFKDLFLLRQRKKETFFSSSPHNLKRKKVFFLHRGNAQKLSNANQIWLKMLSFFFFFESCRLLFGAVDW